MTVDFLDGNGKSTRPGIGLQVHCVCMCGVIAVNHDDIASLVNSQMQMHCKSRLGCLNRHRQG
ncbi:hypothetical protein EC9_23020 [Rosistilla ulvae]|uniref:Uncharacterized protein n=1 Tax=Rosistilla ulvae TaxID=1930277 RepID=A0A517LZR7_9BACT|nr:hypothetical protein EC9_23020 [Rosistilla ulvae]